MSDLEQEHGEIAHPSASIGWWRQGPLGEQPLFLFAHGAGAPSASEFMRAVSAGLVKRGVTVVRFDFPYMRRAADEGRRRPPDRPAILLDACRAILRQALSWKRPVGKIVVGGKSMGGRMWSMLLADETPPGVCGALYFGYPLHPPGKPTSLRAAHLPSVPVPQLFLSGSRDSLAEIERLRQVVHGLPGARLHVVEGADHSLAVSRREPLRGSDLWLDEAAQFVHDLAT